MGSRVKGSQLILDTINRNLKNNPHFYDPPPKPVGQVDAESGKVVPVLPRPNPNIVSGLSVKERRELQERIAALDYSASYWKQRALRDEIHFEPSTGLPDHLETWPSAYSPSAYWERGITRVN